MPASSLIFAVIIAVWAAYLVQHWIRRRDHVATARSVDRFSEAMRVLERRQQQLGVPGASPRSYAVALTRPPGRETPARPAMPAPAASPGPSAGAGARRAARPTTRSARPAGPAAAARTFRPAALRRGLVLGAVAALALTVALAVGQLLPGWMVLPGLLVLAVSLTLARASATRRTGSASRAAPRLEESPTAGETVPAPDVAPRHRPAAPRRAAPTDNQPYDVAAVEAAVAGRSAAPLEAALVAEPAPGSWQPVPVPPPAYTLKPRAMRPARRAAAFSVPVEDLPFDGNALALEEEFEELPAVHGVG